jgi:hypothetical protein
MMIDERFVLESKGEQGRFGTVYRAIDTQAAAGIASQYVALWCLPGEFGLNKPALELFKQDFARVGAFEHPSVARVFEFGHDGDSYFVTSELLNGETLRNVLDHLRPERLDKSEADEIVASLGDALALAQEHGIFHGDVRAENVFVTLDHKVKLLNFMTASLMRRAPFAAGPADDVRGLAAMAYELYTGKPAGAVPRRAPGLSRRCWKAIERALADDPRRGASMRQFLAAAGLATDGLLRRSPPRYLRPVPERRPVWHVAAAMAAIAVGIWYFGGDLAPRLEALRLAGSALPGSGSREATVAPDDALEGEGNPVGEPALARGSSELGRPSAAALPAKGGPPPSAADAAVPVEAGRGRKAVQSDETFGLEDAADAAARELPAAASTLTPRPPAAVLRAASLTAYESQTALSVDVHRSGDNVDVPIEFVWWTSDGTARAGDDYASFGRRVETLLPGETIHTLYVPITSDVLREEDEHFFIHLASSPTSANLEISATLRVTLIDDDR